MDNCEIIILRPYITLDTEGAGVDRYLTLFSELKKSNIKTLLFTTNFNHQKKEFRKVDNLCSNIKTIDAGSYKSNISIKRLIYEFIFSYKSYLIIKKINPKVILIGEPLFFCWMFFGLLRLKKKFTLAGDFIDLLPESYMIKFKTKFTFWALFWPLFVTRWFRCKFVYDKIYTVSDYYKNKISFRELNPVETVYWGYSFTKPYIPNEEGKKTLVYAGSLGVGYDIETLIELGKIRKDIRIIIAGAGPKSKICQDAHDQNFITYKGLVRGDELKKVYVNASVGILPYAKNSAVSMPIKLYEYLNYQLKIVSSLEMECAQIVSEYKLGFSYEAGNVSSLNEAVDKTLMMSLNSENYTKLHEKFELEMQYSNFAKSLMSLVNKN